MRSLIHTQDRVTWIEVAIVTVVLAVLAALTVPQFSQADITSQDKELRAAVQVVQGQIEMYRAQHNNRYPTLAQFTEQMTMGTNDLGHTAKAGTEGFDRGPYLRCIPVNPYSGTRNVGNGPGGTSAWYYDELTGQFRANHAPLN